MNRLAEFVVRNRVVLLAVIGIITLLFLYQFSKVSIKTRFADLLPQKHPYIQVHNKIRNIFGGANQVLIMVQVRQGDIFNRETLEKVKWISTELEKVPGVDPYKIRSISVPKMKDFSFSSGTTRLTPR